MKGTTILSDYLAALGVKHTGAYSDDRFRNMPFRTLFGFTRLLNEYGIGSQCALLTDKQQVKNVSVPFIAQLGSQFVIVKSFEDDKVSYILFHDRFSVPVSDFISKFSGVVLVAKPGSDVIEPEYKKHHLYELADLSKKLILILALLFVGVAGFIQSGIGRHMSLVFLLATDLAGIAVCYLLMLKSHKVRSHAADKFCGILQKHGCDTVLEQKASTFFGLFSWSEVGMTYFSVSTVLLFLFSEQWHMMALINGLCLPFTVWSISYQKFVIKAWCTMCVTVQTLLWCQFFCFLLGGWWHKVFPLSIGFFEMGAAYIAVLLGLNALMKQMK